MSWIPMAMKFPGTCLECGKKIKSGERGMWSRGVGVKHEACAGQGGIPCIICGGPAGCSTCELADSCDIQNVSPLCICKKCDSGAGPLSYRSAAAKKFPALSAGG